MERERERENDVLSVLQRTRLVLANNQTKNNPVVPMMVIVNCVDREKEVQRAQECRERNWSAQRIRTDGHGTAQTLACEPSGGVAFGRCPVLSRSLSTLYSASPLTMVCCETKHRNTTRVTCHSSLQFLLQRKGQVAEQACVAFTRPRPPLPTSAWTFRGFSWAA